MIRVAINGFGRIGRSFLRCWAGRSDSAFKVVALNVTIADINAGGNGFMPILANSPAAAVSCSGVRIPAIMLPP